MRETSELSALERRYLGCCLPEEEFVERIGRLREEQKRTQRKIEAIRSNPLAFDPEEALRHESPDDECCPCKCCLVEEDRHCWSREGPNHHVPELNGYGSHEYGTHDFDDYEAERAHWDEEEESQRNVPTKRERELERSHEEQRRWRPKSTVPRPFFMTLRDETEQPERQRRIAQLREEKEREEMLELEYARQIRFKAKPVPPSTYFPSSSFPIRKSRLSYSSNRLHEDGEAEFPLRRSQSEGISLYDQHPLPKEPFKAREVPLSTYKRPIDEEIKIQKRATEKSNRALRLLQSSRPPKGIIDHATRSNLVHRIRHEAKCVEKPPQQRRSVSIPDFTAIHEKLERKLQSAKARKPPTVVKPFHFSPVRSHEPHCENDIPEKFTRIPMRLTLSTGNLSEKVPIRMTTAQLLRSKAIRSKMSDFERTKNAARNFWKERAEESHSMQRKLGKLSAGSPSPSKEIAQMASERRASMLQRTEEYQREIAAMKNRVATQPLVLERQMILMEKQRVDRMVKSALRDAKDSALLPPLPSSRRTSRESGSSLGTQGTHVITRMEEPNGFKDDFESESTSASTYDTSPASKPEESESESESSSTVAESNGSADLSRITEQTEHSD